MELSHGAEELVTRALTYSMERGTEELYVEDLFRAMLTLAAEEPKGELASDIRTLWEILRPDYGDLAENAETLAEKCRKQPSLLVSAVATLGRAAEKSGEKPIGAELLCRTVLEKKTPLILQLTSSDDDEGTIPSVNAEETVGNLIFDAIGKNNPILFDDLDDPDDDDEITISPNDMTIRDDEDEEDDLDGDDKSGGRDPADIDWSSEFREALEFLVSEGLASVGNDPDVTKPEDQSTKDEKRREREREIQELFEQRKSGSDTDREAVPFGVSNHGKTEDELIDELSHMLAGLMGSGEDPAAQKKHEEEERKKKEEEQRRKEEEERRKRPESQPRRTKLGLITYRGGKVAAAIQYYLLGILAPVAVFAILEATLHLFTEPMKPIIEYLCMGFVVCWFGYLIRGVNLMIGWKNKYVGLFLNVLLDILMLGLLVEGAAVEFFHSVEPLWLKVVLFAATLGFLLGGSEVIDRIPHEEDEEISTLLLRKEREGSAAKILTAYALRLLTLPCYLAFPAWIMNVTAPLWAERVLRLLGFALLWIFFFNVWDCVTMRAELPKYRYTARKKLLKFFENAHLLMVVPELVLYLHYVFAWNPMKKWVMLLLGIGSLLVLALSAATAKNEE